MLRNAAPNIRGRAHPGCTEPTEPGVRRSPSESDIVNCNQSQNVPCATCLQVLGCRSLHQFSGPGPSMYKHMYKTGSQKVLSNWQLSSLTGRPPLSMTRICYGIWLHKTEIVSCSSCALITPWTNNRGWFQGVYVHGHCSGVMILCLCLNLFNMSSLPLILAQQSEETVFETHVWLREICTVQWSVP